ncbi:hypothetical protein H8S95_06195 [Pontibacter sp. KCTC 32443]|uniref:hypothetical protein n=1 Tax=Pontibacter TaxID=323449 RepID=UPI00164D587B|nr:MULTISPECIES: hypothetical protein [Pontibacter]MBC5773646.1 hypothetical protein [Pontibacter sp. KCTC 32443]
MRGILIAVFVVVFMVACGPTTQIVKSWRDPGATVTQAANNKILVIAMVKDETSRRVVEDQLVKRMTGKAVASYSMLNSEAMKSGGEAALNNMLTDGQYTHILMVRLADIEEETRYVPGATHGYYGGYGRYYGYGAAFYTDPGYYTTDKNYMVETLVYTVNPDKLVWAGTTETVNPTDIDKTINEIADAVAAKMREDGFLI